MKTIKTILRWIGTFTVPYLTTFLFSVIATHICRIWPVYGDHLDGSEDGLSLLGVSFTSGIIFVLVTKYIAPSQKKFALITNAVLISLWVVASLVFYFDVSYKAAGGPFGIMRMCTFLVSVWVSLCLTLKSN
jgi:uncharacterized membrane protein YoaT (DUF817 family)